MSFSEYISPLVGRLILAWFFLSQALFYAGQWDATVQLMALKGVPVPPVLLMLSLIVIWLGSLSLVLGFRQNPSRRSAAVRLHHYRLGRDAQFLAAPRHDGARRRL